MVAGGRWHRRIHQTALESGARASDPTLGATASAPASQLADAAGLSSLPEAAISLNFKHFLNFSLDIKAKFISLNTLVPKSE